MTIPTRRLGFEPQNYDNFNHAEEMQDVRFDYGLEPFNEKVLDIEGEQTLEQYREKHERQRRSEQQFNRERARIDAISEPNSVERARLEAESNIILYHDESETYNLYWENENFISDFLERNPDEVHSDSREIIMWGQRILKRWRYKQSLDALEHSGAGIQGLKPVEPPSNPATNLAASQNMHARNLVKMRQDQITQIDRERRDAGDRFQTAMKAWHEIMADPASTQEQRDAANEAHVNAQQAEQEAQERYDRVAQALQKAEEDLREAEKE